MSLFDFWWTHRAELGRLLSQHAIMVLVSTAVAVAIGIPAGIYAARHRRAGRAILAIACRILLSRCRAESRICPHALSPKRRRLSTNRWGPSKPGLRTSAAGFSN